MPRFFRLGATTLLYLVLVLPQLSALSAQTLRQWATTQALAAGETIVETNQLLAMEAEADVCSGDQCKPLRDALLRQDHALLSARGRSSLAHAHLESARALLGLLTQLTHDLERSEAAARGRGEASERRMHALASFTEASATLDAIEASVATAREALALARAEAANGGEDVTDAANASPVLAALAANEAGAGVRSMETKTVAAGKPRSWGVADKEPKDAPNWHLQYGERASR